MYVDLSIVSHLLIINQSINQSKHISIAPYVASESEAESKHFKKITTQLWIKNMLCYMTIDYWKLELSRFR